LFIEIGFAPAKESCLDLPMLESKAVPLIMAEVRESVSWKLAAVVVFLPCDEGEDDEFRVGVAMSIGEVIGIVNRSLSRGVDGGSSSESGSGVEVDEVKGDPSRESWAPIDVGVAALSWGLNQLESIEVMAALHSRGGLFSRGR
jgi:hypothetical protein